MQRKDTVLMMNSKEKRYVRKLEIRCEELDRHFRIANSSSAGTFLTLFETRAAMRQAYEAVCDAERVLRGLMQDDPAFVEMRAKIIQGDF